MNDFGFPKRKKRGLDDLNVVPILDMFISIVFFLLLSASMVGMTKLVLPPSATSSVESTSTKVPLNPKLYIIASSQVANGVKAILQWEGDAPGKEAIDLPFNVLEKQDAAIADIKKLIQKFKDQHPDEKTIQLALQSGIMYQWLITAMDGAREILPDIVLVSYDVADGLKE